MPAKKKRMAERKENFLCLPEPQMLQKLPATCIGCQKANLGAVINIALQGRSLKQRSGNLT